MSDALNIPSDAAIAQSVREQQQRGYYAGAIDCIKDRAREIDALRIGTHADDCHTWGPRHYECALRQIDTLRAEVESLKARTRDADYAEAEAYQLTAAYERQTAYAITHKGVMRYCSSEMRDAYSDAICRAEKAEAALAECREDAERLEWLSEKNADTSQEAWVVTHRDFSDEEDYAMYWVGADLRAAIDAARAK